MFHVLASIESRRANSLGRPGVLAALAAVLLVPGCMRQPKGPEQPSFDAAAAGAEAIRLYDTNGDRRLDENELKKCPGFLHALERADADGDRTLTADEIAARIEKWFASGTVIMDWPVSVDLDGKPLEGATVVFEPEPFLGSGFKTCRGTTDKFGHASLRGSDAAFPGVYVGAYRVKISKKVNGKEIIPPRYNTETELGWEVADDIPGVASLIEFHLKSR